MTRQQLPRARIPEGRAEPGCPGAGCAARRQRARSRHRLPAPSEPHGRGLHRPHRQCHRRDATRSQDPRQSRIACRPLRRVLTAALGTTWQSHRLRQPRGAPAGRGPDAGHSQGAGEGPRTGQCTQQRGNQLIGKQWSREWSSGFSGHNISEAAMSKSIAQQLTHSREGGRDWGMGI